MYRSRPLMSSPCDRRQQQQQQILVVYACRTVGEMWLKPQIDHLLQQLRSRALGLEFKFHVFISQASSEPHPRSIIPFCYAEQPIDATMGTVSQLPPSETFELQSQTSANTEICFERLTSRRLQDDVLRWLLGTSSSTAASAEFDTSRAAETQAVVCGPATFNRDVRASLIEFGLSHITCLD
ncbi:hypothetical protein EV182_000580 [Spiromyces aspiralis]|uniref:Uncharacterized protein n=1 Tax=Spiromyces aspiralis TaxID=68401 RepID=A0ACC1HKW1_9FUNG|nr:hypothetical protein EV182_000580 [Spiromyces aspiralis]